MNNQTRTNIATDFINTHKSNNLQDWLCFDNADLLAVYNKLVGGEYGEVRTTNYNNELEIEIGTHESKSGNPIIFEWEDDEFKD